jgi:type IV pilus assembly protein PilQ
MNTRFRWLLVPALLAAALTLTPAVAQTDPVVTPAAAPADTPVAAGDGLVTLNADDTLIAQILNAFSRQTGRSIVVGPDVTGRATVRLTGVPWEAALEAILKPFGYGHYDAGNATVVCGTDVLVPRLFTLKYMDAGDVEDLVRTVMSPRGKFSKVVARGQSWSAATEGGGTSLAGGTTMGKRQRSVENKDLTKTKTILVTDISAALDQVGLLLEKVDRVPSQILIEARFLEASPRVLRDVGVEFGTGANGVTTPGGQSLGVSQGGDAYGIKGQQVSGGVAPGNFSPFSAPSMNGTYPFNAGLNLAFQRLSDAQFQVLLHLLQENASVNVLSAPRILTLNNQEASIIVGTKYPIINSDASGGQGTTATITTSLRGYEDIGIQLNVLPQICDGNFISMVVRPSVREQIGSKSGKTVSGEITALTEYPVISTREAETQVIVRDGQTIVIGGLLKDKQSTSTIKVPILGDIPLLGALFRRQTDQSEKIDLLIFLTASIVPAEGSSLINTNLAGQAGVPVRPPAAAPTVVVIPTPPVVPTPAPDEAAPLPATVLAAPLMPVDPVVPGVEAPAVPAAVMADTPAVIVISAPSPVAAPEAAPPKPEVAVTTAPAPVVTPVVTAVAPGSAGDGAGDGLEQAIQRARAASVAAENRASEIRREFGLGGAAGAPAAAAP